MRPRNTSPYDPPELRHPAPYEDECPWDQPRWHPEHTAMLCLVIGSFAVGFGAFGRWMNWF